MSITSIFISSRNKTEHRFETLFRPHIQGLYRSAYHWTSNTQDAEDLVQDLAVVVLVRLAEFSMIEHPRAWLLRIMYRRFVDLHRRQKANPVIAEHILENTDLGDMDQPASERQNPVVQLELSRMQKKLQEALNDLDKDQRVAVMLFDVEGYSLKEIASIVDIPEGTVKSRLHRARAHLKKAIGPELFSNLARVCL